MMEQTDFIAFRKELARIVRGNENTCREGYLRLWRCETVADLIRVIRHYWADLNRMLWPEFQTLLRTYYGTVETEMKANGIYYNVPCENGLCAVDEFCETDCLVLKGHADAVVHRNASVLLLDQAHATLLDTSRAVARNSSSVDARGWSQVTATDFSRVRAFDKAKVTSNGATEIYMYGESRLVNFRSRKLEAGVSARVEDAAVKEITDNE